MSLSGEDWLILTSGIVWLSMVCIKTVQPRLGSDSPEESFAGNERKLIAHASDCRGLSRLESGAITTVMNVRMNCQ